MNSRRVPSPFKVDQGFPNSLPNERLIDKRGPQGRGVSGEQLFKRWIHGFKALTFNGALYICTFTPMNSAWPCAAESHFIKKRKKARSSKPPVAR